MMGRGRTPLRVAMVMVSLLAIGVPFVLGVPSLAAFGFLVLVALGANLRAADRGVRAFRGPAHLVYALALVAVGYAVFELRISPVITVYFPSLILLGAAHILGARAAVLWSVPCVALVAAGTFLPVSELRDTSPMIEFVVRAGTLLTILSFAVSFRRAHDRQADELARLAATDALTGLSNRIELEQEMDRALDRAARYGRRAGVVFVDVDGMKWINDSHGHGAGDEFLREIARRIRKVTRAVDTAARIGGDEFVVLLSEFEGAKGAEVYARKLLGALGQPWRCNGTDLRPSASIGVALFPDVADSSEGLLARADTAMYAAKRDGGGRVFVHGDQGPEAIE